MWHGWQKLFVKTKYVVDAFVGMGLPPWMAYLAGAIELFGGGLLILGLFTRVAGLILCAQMAVAMWKYNLAEGWRSVPDYELPLVLGLAALVLAATGAGKISLDWAIFRDKA